MLASAAYANSYVGFGQGFDIPLSYTRTAMSISFYLNSTTFTRKPKNHPISEITESVSCTQHMQWGNASGVTFKRTRLVYQ